VERLARQVELLEFTLRKARPVTDAPAPPEPPPV